MAAPMTKLFVIQNITRLTDDQLAQAIASNLITIEDLHKFLPSIANERIEAINEQIAYAMVDVDYQEACDANNVEAYRAFIDKYPRHHYAHQAQQAIDTLQYKEIEATWNSCEQNQDPKLYQDFLAKFPNSKYAPIALERLEEEAWQSCDNNDIASLRSYLASYPDGRYSAMAMAIVEELERLLREEDEIWTACQERNSITGYESYIRQYPQGKYVAQARLLVDELCYKEREMKNKLFEEMRYYPELFPWDMVADAITYGEITYDGYKISLTGNELVDNGLIRRTALNHIASGITFREAPQLKFQDLPPLPEGNTDVYFFGVPASGKSTVLSALLTLGRQRGQARYRPNMINSKDPCLSYYETLTTNLDYEMLPPRTQDDTCNTIGIGLHSADGKFCNPLSFVEIGGEYFLSVTADLVGEHAKVTVSNHGATAFLSNNNRKILFFLIDYSSVVDKNSKTDVLQRNCLSRALITFSNQGVFSKTDTVCVIVTKSDKMGVYDPEERYKLAHQYLTYRHQDFISELTDACRQFGMNKEVGCQPIVMTFSIGEVGIGDTVHWDTRDAEILLNFILNHTRAHRTAPSFIDKLKDAFKH
ncbi:hypothetical protein HQ29_07230 [Porphyromonas canoris]|uniref:hypothetical protein n=1 Tax=Porphyromonas canoris TaxID=36875 RepID=UPI00051DB1DC|nr:hypothetical protein [Porphyromonas canoris]KGL51765.1 hypothetical protein HQ29_07230 [Porphyromonas canoris]